MSSVHQNGKIPNQPRPDSGYYGSPMDIDGTSPRSSSASRASVHGEIGRFGNLNGSASSISSSSSGGDLVLTAGMSMRSPATRRRAVGGPMGASVTRVVRSGDASDETRSTTVLRPASGGSDGASVRPNYSTRPGACDNVTDDVLGVITIGEVKDEEGGHKGHNNGTSGQKEETGFGCGGGYRPHIRPQKPIIPDPPKPQVYEFEIFVKNANGKTYTFSVTRSETVDSLLGKIHDRLDMNTEQFWLNFGGKRLNRGKTLASYGIKEHSTIFVELRLRGG